MSNDLACPKDFVGKCAASIYKAQAKLENTAQFLMFKAYLNGDTDLAQSLVRKAARDFELRVLKAHDKAVAAGSSCPFSGDLEESVEKALEFTFRNANERVTTAAGTR